MFGNRLGWSISLLIVIVAGWLGYALQQAAHISPPTGWASVVVPIQLPPQADSVVPEMNDPRDAGVLIRAAIEDEEANVAEYAALESAETIDPADWQHVPRLKAFCADFAAFGIDKRWQKLRARA